MTAYRYACPHCGSALTARTALTVPEPQRGPSGFADGAMVGLLLVGLPAACYVGYLGFRQEIGQEIALIGALGAMALACAIGGDIRSSSRRARVEADYQAAHARWEASWKCQQCAHEWTPAASGAQPCERTRVPLT